MAPKGQRKKIFLLVGLACFFLALALVVMGYLYHSGRTFGVLQTADLTQQSYHQLPQDALFIAPSRQAYETHSMRLIIPKLELDTTVAGNTTPADLLEHPGLYEYSQMPGEGDANVSIAGHRDLGEQEFYYLDTLTEGDSIYLQYGGLTYHYVYRSSEITGATDWSCIARKGYSAITLTTCDPIGTDWNRLVVTGQLRDITKVSP